MKRLLVVVFVVALLCGIWVYGSATSKEIKEDHCFFLNSLHYTANGMEYWYSKERGGLEILTGIPYENLGCKNCHTPGCDRCHEVEKTINECTISAYSTDSASNQSMCLKCHGRERAMIAIDHKAKQEDVHIAMGMMCVDCHSQREMHGDGKEYVSLKQPGAMDTQCENCHDSVDPIEAHTVHNDKLDCKACHVRHVVSCTNCHFNTLVKEGKRKALPVSGWVFLMNYKDKVSSASMQTFVTEGNKTFLLFAPHMSHSVMKEGRACEDCHATDTMRRANEGSVDLTWLKNGKLMNQKGVIPVVDGVNYECVYQDVQDGKWVPIENPPEPLLQYVAFGKPLTQEQLEKLVESQESPTPKME
jgi:hypothetical protein